MPMLERPLELNREIRGFARSLLLPEATHRPARRAIGRPQAGETRGGGVVSRARSRTRLRRGRDLHAMQARGRPDTGGVRGRRPRRRPDVHRRRPRVPRGSVGRAVRGRRRSAVEPDARRDRPRPRRRLHRERREVPATGQPGSRTGRDRGLHAVADRTDLADPAPGDRHARQLRDEVRPEHDDRHHAPPGPDPRVARAHGDPHVPPGGDPARRRRAVAAVRGAPRGSRPGPPDPRRRATHPRADPRTPHRPRRAPEDRPPARSRGSCPGCPTRPRPTPTRWSSSSRGGDHPPRGHRRRHPCDRPGARAAVPRR